jgi:UDP-glucose 4-epimerase
LAGEKARFVRARPAISWLARIFITLLVMKILFTGASSFSGFWFVRQLAGAGYEVICPITHAFADYTGMRRQRIQQLEPVCRLVPLAPFGSMNFMKLVESESFNLLCHHAADATNYKSQNFDVPAALRNNTCNLPSVLAEMVKRSLKSIVVTGTYFEAGEGTGDEPLRAFSPYSLSKTLTFETFQKCCADKGLTPGKFVMPNPFGPLEEPRFTAYLMKSWKAAQTVEVRTPDYLRDNIHVSLLAIAYQRFVEKVATTKCSMLKINPSGYAESQGRFAQRVASEVRARTNWRCELKLLKQEDFSEPLKRANIESAAQTAPGWSETAAWDEFVRFYL